MLSEDAEAVFSFLLHTALAGLLIFEILHFAELSLAALLAAAHLGISGLESFHLRREIIQHKKRKEKKNELAR